MFMPQRVGHTTHLVKHSVSKTQQLPKEVEPAVQEGKETQQKEHYTYKRETNREEQGTRNTFILGIAPSFLIGDGNLTLMLLISVLKAIHLRSVINLLYFDTWV